jgi:ferritin heavy chain
LKKPEKDEWGSGLESMEAALQLEKDVNQNLIELNAIAVKNNDYQVR